MKKSILTALLFCLTLFLCFAPQPKTTTASGDEYACILTTDAYFYSAPENPLFLLPKTYYVKILNHGAEYTKIEYLYDSDKVKKVVGYAKTNQLTFVDYTPNEPYLYKLLELRYTMNGSPDGSLGEIVLTCAYYGDYTVGGKAYCYVLRGEDFGYIEKPSGFSYPENTEYASRNPQQPTAEPTQSNASSPTQIAILICLCLLVPILAGLILRPPHRPPYEDD